MRVRVRVRVRGRERKRERESERERADNDNDNDATLKFRSGSAPLGIKFGVTNSPTPPRPEANPAMRLTPTLPDTKGMSKY